ncbi:protein kinase [Acidobacteriota bacterium]
MQRYRVLKRIGKGGMGEILLAEDRHLHRKVAVKFLLKEREQDKIALERLRREARSAAALDHPFICKIYDVAESTHKCYIVMEYVVGETLEERLETGPLSLDEVRPILLEIADALEAAHRHGIAHRDLKPSNIMLTSQGHVKVMDFGLAKHIQVSGEMESGAEATESRLTRDGFAVGTPGYMSPEQLCGEAVDGRSDVFSFGVIVFQMLTGQLPFRRDSTRKTMVAILKDEPVLDSLPPAVAAFVGKLLAKDPQERYQTFTEVKESIGHLTAAPSTAQELASGLPLLVGRKNELDQLERLLEESRQGRGSLAFITGEPGVGKTRLVRELAYRARLVSTLVATGHCHEGEGTPPFLSFIEAFEAMIRIVPKAQLRGILGDAAPEIAELIPELRRLYPDIPSPIDLPPEQQRRYLFNGCLGFLQRVCRHAPVVLILEDLQWADESTIQLLQHIAPKVSETAILIVATTRDEEVDSDGLFARAQEALMRQRLVTSLALKRLSKQDTARMLSSLGPGEPPDQIVDALYTGSEGNPFFVEEVFRHLCEEGKILDEGGGWQTNLPSDELGVPQGVRWVIDRRLDRISKETIGFLSLSAVVGSRFRLKLLRDLIGEKLLDSLEEAERAHLISPVHGEPVSRYAFEHELIRQTLLSRLSLPRRQQLHLEVAKAIERTYCSDDALELAHHFYQAGELADQNDAIRFITMAGERALRTAAAGDALRYFNQAYNLLKQMSETDENRKRIIELIRLMNAPHTLLGWPEASFPLLRESERLAGMLNDERNMILSQISMAFYYYHRSMMVESVELAEKAFSNAKKLDDIDLMVPAAWGLCFSQHATGGYYSVVSSAPGIIRQIERAGRKADYFGRSVNPYSSLNAICAASLALLGRFEEGRLFSEQGIRNAIEIGDVGNLAMCEFTYGTLLLTKGEHKTAAGHLEKANKHALEAGLSLMVVLSHAAEAIAYASLGEIETGRTLSKKALAAVRERGLSTPFPHLAAGICCFEAGEVTQAINHLEESIKLHRSSHEKGMEAVSLIWLGRILGKKEPSKGKEAEELILQGIQTLKRLKMKPHLAMGYLFLAECRAGLGRKLKAYTSLRKARSMFQKMKMDRWLDRIQTILDERRG